MLTLQQIEPVNKAYELLKEYKLCYLNCEKRTGKTTMALTLANMLNCKNVLFVTKAKVVRDKSVWVDYNREKFTFKLTVTNYEQIQKLKPEYDLIIGDEAHKFGAFPKSAQRTKAMKRIVGKHYLILMSATAHPESMSQLYHQFWLSDNSPFQETNFYKWAHQYVNIYQVVFNGVRHNNYEKAKEDAILSECGHLFVKLSQEEAGFAVHELIDTIIEVDMDPRIYRLADDLLRDRVYTLRNGDNIICDTAVSLQGKMHQIFSGTVKGENDTHILDYSKAKYIKEHHPDEKIVIFYKYIAEGDAIKKIHEGEWTDLPSEFNSGKKRVFVSQLQSGCEGINLSSGNTIIYYNIDFSYVIYDQSRARTQARDKTNGVNIYWLFARGGIENKIYKKVLQKKDYSSYYFKKDFMSDYIQKGKDAI